jgi:ATP-binding cassette subfamily D (ALD) protein 4
MAIRWCLFGSLVNFFLARRLPAAQYSLEKREGNMRFAHMRIRTYAESIAFFGGESQEKELVDKVSAKKRIFLRFE